MATINGSSGNDTLTGAKGYDSIYGGDGDDAITFAEGDSVFGGAGDDTLIAANYNESGINDVTIDGGDGTDRLTLGDKADLSTLVIASDDASGKTGSVKLDDGSTISFAGIEKIVCFTPGAMIATPLGERAVETLQVGDKVVTRDHGLQTIRWVGQKTVQAEGLLAPVLIKPGVVTGLDRPLLVSPQHRMLFQGYRAELLFGETEVLVSAKHLIDGRDVVQQSGSPVTYIHMLFDEHEIIYANGAATESFHPGSFGMDAIDDAAREELFTVFPELRADVSTYGQTARRCLRKYEAQMVRI